jgi:hypothetical protein
MTPAMLEYASKSGFARSKTMEGHIAEYEPRGGSIPGLLRIYSSHSEVSRNIVYIIVRFFIVR